MSSRCVAWHSSKYWREKRERERETIQCLSHKGPNRYGAIWFNAGTFSWVGESMKGWCWLRAFWRHACLALAEYSPGNADTGNQAQEIHVDCRYQCCSAGIDAFRLGRFGFDFDPGELHACCKLAICPQHFAVVTNAHKRFGSALLRRSQFDGSFWYHASCCV